MTQPNFDTNVVSSSHRLRMSLRLMGVPPSSRTAEATCGLVGDQGAVAGAEPEAPGSADLRANRGCPHSLARGSSLAAQTGEPRAHRERPHADQSSSRSFVIAGLVWKRVHCKPPSAHRVLPWRRLIQLAMSSGLYGLMKNASNVRSSLIGGAYAEAPTNDTPAAVRANECRKLKSICDGAHA